MTNLGHSDEEICGLVLRATSRGIDLCIPRELQAATRYLTCVRKHRAYQRTPSRAGLGLLNYLPFPLHVSLLAQ